MRIEQLEQVKQIAMTKSLGKAASSLFLTQPALSYSIKSLEEELGAPLFMRTSKGMLLTPFGEEFLSYSEPIFQHWEVLKSPGPSLAKEIPTVFGVSCTYLRLPNRLYTELIEKYRQQGVYFHYYERPIQGVVEDLLERRSEIGIVSISGVLKKRNQELFRQNGIQYTPICQDPNVYVLVGRHNPLFHSPLKQLTADMLVDYPILCYGKVFHSFITDYNLMGLGHLKNRIIVYDRAVYHDILTSSDCFAISNFGSNIYLPHNENSQIRVFSMANPYRGFHGYEVGWVCLEDHPLSNIAQDFMRCFIELTNESLAEKRRLSELTP